MTITLTWARRQGRLRPIPDSGIVMRTKFFLGFLVIIAFPARAQERAPVAKVIHLATALDHLTAIEFGEPVTLVAAGSDAFDIQRRDDKVLIKPLAAGASTDLLVWTSTRRLIYELDPPGEVKDMNFAVDSRMESGSGDRKPAAQGRNPQDSADALMARAFLAAQPVANAAVHDQKDAVTVRVEHVLVSKNSIYLHCSIRNLGRGSYTLMAPKVERLLVAHPAISLVTRSRSQLTGSEMGKMRGVKSFSLAPASVQVSNEQVAPGQSAEAVIALAQPIDPAALLSLTFVPYGTRAVQAFVVL